MVAKTRIRARTGLTCLTASFCALLLMSTVPSVAQGKSELRLYKMSKYGQSQRIRFTGKKSKLAGCQNLLLRARVHRAVQYGFESCTLYTSKDCLAGSEVAVKRTEQEPDNYELEEGFSWFLGAPPKDDAYPKYTKDERGQKLKSWQCQTRD